MKKMRITPAILKRGKENEVDYDSASAVEKWSLQKRTNTIKIGIRIIVLYCYYKIIAPGSGLPVKKLIDVSTDAIYSEYR